MKTFFKIGLMILAFMPMEKIMTDQVEKQAITIVGISCKTSNAPDAASVDIPKLWKKFYEEGIAEKIPNKTSDAVFALYCDYEGDYTKPYSLVIGCPVASDGQVPDGMVAKTIPQGTYAIFTAVGDYPASVVKAWQEIWSSDLQRTYTGDYELYNTSQDIQIYIAVQE